MAEDHQSKALLGDNPLTQQVVRSVHVLTQMMTDRGLDHKLKHITTDECIRATQQRETLQVSVTDNTLLVMYLTTRHNGTSVKNDLRKRINGAEHRTVILVFREMPLNGDTIAAKLREDHPNVKKIEMFSLSELQYNVTEHCLVPKHERVNDPEAIRSVLKLYGIKRNQLPVIQKSDVVCRYLGIESGDLVRIHRVSPSSGIHVAYRMCV
jgi:DNA-directed RNA polymerase subunit H (RpoH/RPB5)